MFTILIILAVLAVVWVISTTNGFKRKEIKIDEALSGIEVALTKRYDTESDLFADVISLRSGMSVNEMGKADREMGELTGRLFAVAENYPELRSSEVFMELQRGIRDAEEHLQAARRLYNANVSRYNTAIAIFPASLLAKGRSPKEFYDADDAKLGDIKMQF